MPSTSECGPATASGSSSSSSVMPGTSASSNAAFSSCATEQDHELFLQAFEKPTQIYRYLRTRHRISPIILNRNLTFMRSRLSRGNAARSGFKVDSLLGRKEVDIAASGGVSNGFNKGFMTLTFLGYYDKRRERPLERVACEIFLSKMAHKKRKESSSPMVQESVGTSEVPVNPSEDHPPSKAPALSIPSESFNLHSESGQQSYSLTIRIFPSPYAQMVNGVGSGSHTQQPQGATGNNGEENLEPAAKRRKLLRGSTDDSKVLTAELVVCDRHSRCLLTEGEYELVLNEVEATTVAKVSPKKNNTSWETINLDRVEKTIADQFDIFGCCPTLKFRLQWSGEAAGPMVERPRPLMPRDNSMDVTSSSAGARNSREGSGCSSVSSTAAATGILSRNGGSKRILSSAAAKHSNAALKRSNSRPEKRPPRIVYQFLYNNNTRQQTEAREDLHCPWCTLNCMELYALLKHLKLSHPRFLFTYVPIEEGARIDVSVSDLYDSTYAGNPHDLISQPPGYAFSRQGPVQRTSITNIIVCKPKRATPSLSEFLEADGENDQNGPYDGQRPFVTGHNRLYHYATSNLPMPPHAIIEESTEDKVDPPWLMTKICRMLDEFSDVNAGEKEFMKMWNLHVQHFTYVGDCQMNLALRTFIDEHAKHIAERNLFRNFVVHCCNLFDFGVIGPAYVFTAVVRMQNKFRELKVKTATEERRAAQWADWKARTGATGAGAAAAVAGPSKSSKGAGPNFSGIFNKTDARTQSD